jgi:hypothetical protein
VFVEGLLYNGNDDVWPGGLHCSGYASETFHVFILLCIQVLCVDRSTALS